MVSAWRREAEQRIAETVASSPISWREWRDSAFDSPAAAPVLALSLLGAVPSADERRAAFGRLRAHLMPNTLVIVADHNRPRNRIAALGALLGAPWVPGMSPGSRWRRLAEPTARQLQAAGFRVLRLVLVAHERVQLVIARREGT